MQAIREIRDAASQEVIVKLPVEFWQKRVEILIFPVEEEVSFRTIPADSFELDSELDGLSWNMGTRLYTAREQLYERA